MATWVKNELVQVGFPEVAVDVENGLVTILAVGCGSLHQLRAVA